jgi:acetoacetate decarboxylase
MPAVFGPSVVPDRTVVSDARALVLSFRTAHDRAQELVPGHFSVPADPTISVAHMSYRNVDYLGGRSYNEVVISVSALHGEGEKRIKAAFAPILWVNQVGALVAGREFMGLAKLNGVIPDAEKKPTGIRFRCYEYEALLLEGRGESLTEFDAKRLSNLNEHAAEVRTFGWKYIPAAGGGSDADYPLVNVMRWTYKRAWSGTGSLTFAGPDRVAAPFSSAAMAVLSRIPVIGPIRAFHGLGEAVIDRAATRRLDDSG